MEVDGGDGHGVRGASKLRFDESKVGRAKSIALMVNIAAVRLRRRNAALVGFNMRLCAPVESF